MYVQMKIRLKFDMTNSIIVYLIWNHKKNITWFSE